MAATVQTSAKAGDPTPTKSGPKQLKIGRCVGSYCKHIDTNWSISLDMYLARRWAMVVLVK